MLKDLVRERLGIDEIEIYQIGATIGVHTGPYPIGVGIIKRADWEASLQGLERIFPTVS